MGIQHSKLWNKFPLFSFSSEGSEHILPKFVYRGSGMSIDKLNLQTLEPTNLAFFSS